jgi:adenine-specific DNA-methyltransferase
MMAPRLKLLRDLLSDEGVIFIFCDDNEQNNLRNLMNEIFGEDNFLANIIWQHSIQAKGYAEKFSLHHNHVLMYQKTELFGLKTLERTEEHNQTYSNPDNDPNGDWRTGDIRNSLYRPN